MHRLRLAAGTACAAALALLCACSSNTDGSGEHDTITGLPTAPPTSTPAFPSVAASSTTAHTVVPSLTISSASSTPTSTLHPVPAEPLRTITVNGMSTSYVVKIWAQTKTTDCAGHAYGQPVISYLRAHPCSGLTQILATTTVGGKAVGFAQNSVGFQGVDPAVYKTAGAFDVLVIKDGTGNINDLLREGYRLPSGPTRVPQPDAFDAESQDAGVTIVDAWYLDGPTPDNDPALVTMAHDIYLQF